MTTILITGAGRGIGFEMARQAIDKGWNVIGSVRSVEAQRELAQKLPQMAVLNFDVTDHAAVEKIANAFHSPIDVLVNNAGVIGPETDRQTTSNMDFDGFAKTLETNVLSPLKVTQVFLPLLKQVIILELSIFHPKWGGWSFPLLTGLPIGRARQH